ncbi:hypothetical protein MBLNU459_g6798t1 [Dothideomycetes sp. NU459]
MPGTRSSARIADGSSPASEKTEQTQAAKGTKRKADSSPASAKSKRGRKDTEKDQKTLEETLGQDDDQPEDIEMKDAASAGEGNNPQPDKQEEAKVQSKPRPPWDDEHLVLTAADGAKATNGVGNQSHDGSPSCWFWLDGEKDYEANGADQPALDEDKTFTPGDSFKGKNKEGEDKADPEKALKDSRGGAGVNVVEDEKPADKPDGVPQASVPTPQRPCQMLLTVGQDEVHKDPETKPAHPSGGTAVETSSARKDAMPSNILEKGVIYFFTRGRVGVDDPDSVQDLQRSYFVLRPLPRGAKLGDGAIEDTKNNRLLALPKKVWPKSGQDKFMVFVERANAAMDELKKDFFQGSEYTTKTTGVRQTPLVMPIGEGVYAITSTGDRGESHLAYMLTIPQQPGEMQEDVGLRSKGSFVLSLKNPEVKGPANATLPQTADFPKE